MIRLDLPVLLGACLLAPLACGDSSSSTTATDPGTTAAASTSSGDPSTAADTGSSTGTPPPTTTDAPTTDSSETGATSVDPSTTTGGPPPVLCTSLEEEFLCKNTDGCKWGGVVSYTYGNQGCAGSIKMACIDKTPSGVASAYYRVVDGSPEVIEYGYAPELDPEWQECTCDGPLACLCTSVTMECPERMEEFCGTIGTEDGCGKVTFMGNPACSWFRVDPEGPKDDKCEQKPGNFRCLPSDGPFVDACPADQAPLPPYFGICNDMVPIDPVYWREIDGVVEVIQDCAAPAGFTRCDKIDTPDQPDECGCKCM